MVNISEVVVQSLLLRSRVPDSLRLTFQVLPICMCFFCLKMNRPHLCPLCMAIYIVQHGGILSIASFVLVFVFLRCEDIQRRGHGLETT